MNEVCQPQSRERVTNTQPSSTEGITHTEPQNTEGIAHTEPQNTKKPTGDFYRGLQVIAPLLFGTSLTEGVLSRRNHSPIVVNRDSIGMKSKLPPIECESVEVWTGHREEPEEYLNQQLIAAGLSASFTSGIVTLFRKIRSKSNSKPKPKPKTHVMTRRDFMKGVGAAAVSLFMGGPFLDDIVYQIAETYNVRGAAEIRKNPITALLRAIGKVLEKYNNTNTLPPPKIKWDEEIINYSNKNMKLIQYPIQFERPVLGPAFVNIIDPKRGTKLALVQPSNIDDTYVSASIEKTITSLPKAFAGMSITWGWPLEHADIVRITNEENSHDNLSARYGSAIPYWTPGILEDPIAREVMLALSNERGNPYYHIDLSYRQPPLNKFQQIVCYKPGNGVKLMPIKARNDVIEGVQSNTFDWAIQCHLTISSQDVQTEKDLDDLRHMLDNANFNRISFNGLIFNQDTDEFLCVTTPLTIPLNPAQIYDISRQIARKKGWENWVTVIGDQGGATGTFYKAQKNEVPVIRAGLGGWIPYTERVVREDGRISHPPNIISHTHSLCLALTN